MPSIPKPIQPWDRWLKHVARWRDCTKCELCTQRDKIVLARGDIPAEVMFVGEAPGSSEDSSGSPMVGPAGKIFSEIVNRSVKGPHTDNKAISYIITNLVACFPRGAKNAGTNEPEDSQVEACSPRLRELIDICKPKLLVAVGSLADKLIHYSIPQTVIYAGGKVEGHASIKHMTSVIHPAHIIRMPLMQQSMAANRCVVIISNAIEEVMVQS